MPNFITRTQAQVAIAAIDLGSNALRAVIVRKSGDSIEVVKNFREPLRLGEDVFSNGSITEAKMDLTEEAFIKLLHNFAEYNVTQTRAMATSAMRDAKNGPELAARILEATGIEIETIRGNQEAKLIYSAVRGQLPIIEKKTALLMDIGGGSTELTIVKNGKIIGVHSFNVGVNQIIKNMKDFLHQSEDHKEFCDLDTLLETAVEWIQPTAKKANVKIEKVHEGNRKVALANRIKLEQVVINLVKNSIDALKEMGIPEPLITLRLARSDKENHTYIDIIDNGPGLPESIKANLFKPFQSTKESGSGTGLGLSICAKIIETHKGRLEHISSQSGCHFRIRLPLIEIYSYTRNNRSLSAPKSQKRILVLDNEVQILNVLNSFLQEENYIFIGSSDPQDALGFLSKANVDLIITDFSMPVMNGGQFTRFAREQGYEGPILYMTSPKYIEQFNKDKIELDVGGVIVKPFNRDDVMKTIRHALKTKEGAA